MIRPIYLTHSITGKKELLQTDEEGKLKFYSCGPTVYGLIHIGNLRGGLVADLFFRYFKRVGYDVSFVRNYTDIDDKIIRAALAEGVSPETLANRYIGEVEKDYAVSGMLDPTQKAKATDHITDMVQMIERLVSTSHAYVDSEGEVYFSIEKCPTYGELSRQNLEDLRAGSRVEVNEKKKNEFDFTLWKPAKPGEPAWKSPWGLGRPGWHIECSAMANRWLGSKIDVHHGGEDLLFPHHENEIAQSECATGARPYVRYWLHHAFLTLSREKMSKSVGNILTARDFLTRYSGEVARYFLLGVHYRSRIEFNEDSILQAIAGLERIYEAKKRALELGQNLRARSDLRAESAWGEFMASAEKTSVDMDEHLANDFNTPGVLGSLFSLIRDFNRTLAEPLARGTPASVLGGRLLVRILEEDVGGVLGIGRLPPDKALVDLAEMRRREVGTASPSSTAAPSLSDSEIEKAITDRIQARISKNFEQSDLIRKYLESCGVQIKDSPQGTSWRRI